MQRLHRAMPWLLLTAAILAYIAVRGTFGRPSQLDEIFFKAPGLHWARGEGFRAPEEVGFLGVQPGLETVWAPHPPIYPFLFGLVVRFFGFGWRQCILYDAAIHGALAFLIALVVRRQGPLLPGYVAPLVGAALLPLGAFGRPDELAICFAAAGFLALPVAVPSGLRLALAGSLFGLCAGTHLGTAAVVAPVVMAAVLTSGWSARQMAYATAGVAVAGLGVFAAVVAPLIIFYPFALQQYVVHAHHHFTRGTWLKNLVTSLMLGRSQLVMLVAWLAVGPMTLMAFRRQGHGWEWLKLWAGPLCGGLFLFLFQPDKYYYYWFLAPWLVAAVIGTVGRLRKSFLHLVVVASAGGIYVAAVVPSLQDETMLITLPAGQGIEDGLTTARQSVPPGARVWCNTAWFALANDCTVLDFWLDVSSLSDVDYVVAAGTDWGGTDADHLVTPARRELVERDFDLICDGHAQRQGWLPTHHGTMYPDDGYGFGVRVYRAKRLQPPGGP